MRFLDLIRHLLRLLLNQRRTMACTSRHTDRPRSCPCWPHPALPREPSMVDCSWQIRARSQDFGCKFEFRESDERYQQADKDTRNYMRTATCKTLMYKLNSSKFRRRSSTKKCMKHTAISNSSHTPPAFAESFYAVPFRLRFR